MAERYTKIIDQQSLDDLNYIRENNLIDPSDWGLFQSQLQKEWNELDANWEEMSRETQYPPLSTYGYRKRYMQSIPIPVKQRRGWSDTKADFRIIFNVNKEENEIYYLGIGKRIKGLPKDPDDIWAQIKGRKLPEEE